MTTAAKRRFRRADESFLQLPDVLIGHTTDGRFWGAILAPTECKEMRRLPISAAKLTRILSWLVFLIPSGHDCSILLLRVAIRGRREKRWEEVY
jgi:hypothetical protein